MSSIDDYQECPTCAVKPGAPTLCDPCLARRARAYARDARARDHTKRIDDAITLAVRYGGIDGEHHKTWVIDQMVRILASDGYDEVVRRACDGEDGPDTYTWDVGRAP